MNEPSSESDDSSAASSGDEMLNDVVPLFTQESEKSCGKSVVRGNAEVHGYDRDPAKLPGNKRKRDGASDNFGVKDKAEEKARKAFKEEFSDHQKIGTPDKLFWHGKTKKGKKMIHPVRVVRREEVVGIHLKEWNDETHSAIHSLQYPRDKGGEGMYDTASHKSLSRYHGEGEKHRWCPVKLDQYLKQLKKNLRLNATDLKIEEVFLCCALQKSLAEGEQAEKLKSVDEAVPEEITPDHNVEVMANSESDDEEKEWGGTSRTPRRSAGTQERTEPLRTGDHIEFYEQQSTGGDERSLCTAEILYIDPKGNQGQPLLVINDPMTNLQPDHLVKRVKRKRYGKLVDNNQGVFRPMNEYILKKEGDPNAHMKMLTQINDAAKEHIRRRKEETLKKMEKDGFSRSLAKDALCM